MQNHKLLDEIKHSQWLVGFVHHDAHEVIIANCLHKEWVLAKPAVTVRRSKNEHLGEL